jgi:hypothetical protein
MTKELEDLIKATLEDGILEDYEKEALVKRAQKEGMDLVELEIYINAELQKRQMELREKNEALDAQYEKEKKEAIGPVCPKCGKQVPPLTLVCECGYEFVKAKKESSVSLLMNNIAEIEKNYNEVINKLKEKIELKVEKQYPNYSPDYRQFQVNHLLKSDQAQEEEKKNESVMLAISSFAVPNTKEDIVEFLSTAVPKARVAKKNLVTISQAEPLCWGVGIGLATIGYLLFHWIGALVGGGLGYMASLYLQKHSYDPDSVEFKEAQAWRDKFDEVIIKGRSLRGDPEFTRQLDYYEDLLNKK